MNFSVFFSFLSVVRDRCWRMGSTLVCLLTYMSLWQVDRLWIDGSGNDVIVITWSRDLRDGDRKRKLDDVGQRERAWLQRVAGEHDLVRLAPADRAACRPLRVAYLVPGRRRRYGLFRAKSKPKLNYGRLRLTCVISSTIRAHADQCCWDDVHGCLVMSHASNAVARLGVFTGPSREWRCGAFIWPAGGSVYCWFGVFIFCVSCGFLRILVCFYYYSLLLQYYYYYYYYCVLCLIINK